MACSNQECGSTFPIIDRVARMLPNHLADDLQLTQDKWDNFYQDKQQEQDHDNLYQEYLNTFYPHVLRQLEEHLHLKDKVFSRAGLWRFFAGPGFG